MICQLWKPFLPNNFVSIRKFYLNAELLQINTKLYVKRDDRPVMWDRYKYIYIYMYNTHTCTKNIYYIHTFMCTLTHEYIRV